VGEERREGLICEGKIRTEWGRGIAAGFAIGGGYKNPEKKIEVKGWRPERSRKAMGGGDGGVVNTDKRGKKGPVFTYTV